MKTETGVVKTKEYAKILLVKTQLKAEIGVVNENVVVKT